jgi:drug/metabolite transporter (DMT)-like permease
MKKLFSPLLLFLAAAIWGFAFVAQKAASDVPVFILTAARSIIATVALFCAVLGFDAVTKNGRRLITKKGIDIKKPELIGGVLAGAALFGATVMQQAGINGTDTGKASFITALYVVIVPIYALVCKKRSPLNAWIGVAIATVGFYLLCIKSGFTVEAADLKVFICAFIYALQIMIIDHFIKDCDGIRFSLIQFATVSLLSVVAALIAREPFSASAIGGAVPEILYLGIASSGIAYTLQIIGQKNTHPAAASIILSLESVIGAAAAAVVFGETMTPKEYLGCALVFAAVIISQLDIGSLMKRKKAD